MQQVVLASLGCTVLLAHRAELHTQVEKVDEAFFFLHTLFLDDQCH